MDEDFELNRLVKSALESKEAFVFRPVRQPRFKPRWAVASLLAASVVLVATFAIPFGPREPSVSDVICLLSESENLALDESLKQSSGELLLAWQDAGPE